MNASFCTTPHRLHCGIYLACALTSSAGADHADLSYHFPLTKWQD